MRRIKHIIFWLIVIGLILLLFSSHVIAEIASFQIMNTGPPLSATGKLFR